MYVCTYTKPAFLTHSLTQSDTRVDLKLFIFGACGFELVGRSRSPTNYLQIGELFYFHKEDLDSRSTAARVRSVRVVPL